MLSSSMHLLAAAYVEGLARDVGGQVAGQEGAGVADVLRGLRAAEWDTADERLPAFLAVELAQYPGGGIIPEGGAHDAGAHRVDGDVVRRHFLGQRLGEADHPELGGAVVRQVRQPFLAGHRRDVDDAAGPPPTMAASTRWVTTRTPCKLTLTRRSQSWSVMSRNGATLDTPALLTSTSTGPSRRSICPTAWPVLSLSVTSSRTPRFSPAPGKLSAAASAAPASRSPIATTAPRLARTRAMPAPIPDAPPVTRATFPERPGRSSVIAVTSLSRAAPAGRAWR